ncbi:MAG: hypothetical protein ACLF0G_02345 [Candidatus Brocadiia bacterium]
MARRAAPLLLPLVAATTLWAAEAGDGDGDGIPDEAERLLGTDPARREDLHLIFRDGPEPAARREQEGYDPTKDILEVHFAHVGGDRYLWRATFAAPPRPADTVFHLYVDADADADTGRKGSPRAAYYGTDYMLSFSAGRSWSRHYLADGSTAPGPTVTHVAQGKSLLVSADLSLGRDGEGVHYALYVLCHTATEGGQRPSMTDSCPKTRIDGIPLSDQPKILRPRDYTENFAVDATFGIHRLRRIRRREGVVEVRHDELQLDGFAIDRFTSRRWPHLKLERSNATAWAAAPVAGRYHAGFMMYDDHGRVGRVALYIDGELRGVAVANQDNNRTWLYWLRQPHDFRGGERVELRAAGPGGSHGIINLLFLPRPPEARTIRYAVEHMTARAHPDEPGAVTLSWTTTWPCPTLLHYGESTRYGREYVRETPCLVHRAVLGGLDPETEYHARAVGTSRDGEPFRGDDFAFRARPPAPPKSPSATATVPLTVRNCHPFAVESWPVTTGIPFPQGELASLDHVRLLGDDGEHPAQVRLAARWPDGSVKWILLDFLARAPASGASVYRLEYGRRVHRAGKARGLSVEDHPASRADPAPIDMRTGPLVLTVHPDGSISPVARDGEPLLPPHAAFETVAKDAGGAVYRDSQGEAIRVCEAGPNRAQLATVSHLVGPDGGRLLRLEQRVEAFRGLPIVVVRHTLIVDRPATFTEIEELAYRVPIPLNGGRWRIPLAGGGAAALDTATLALGQRLDNEYTTTRKGRETAAKGRVVGAALHHGRVGVAVAVRDFWQNYPKGFSLQPDGLRVELCPAFDTGFYDAFPFEKEGHHLYYYLLDGHYKLKRGVAKTHDILLCFEPDPEKREQYCALFQRPLLATAPPEWYCSSGAFYDVRPRDADRFPLYEQAIDRNLEAYAQRRERQDDYGMLNYGDWYGERGANWGNIEYDTQHALFLEYIRSANPDAFFLAEAAELHSRDVDTVHWSPEGKQVGAVYVHQMGHVGGYYQKAPPGTLGIPRAGFTVSHAWVEGHLDHYFLTGDRRSRDAALAIADFFIRKQLARPYDFRVCRTPGWHLIMHMAAYSATCDPYYLNAARVIVERVLAAQDVEPRPLPEHQREGRKPFQVGGWSRMMRPGHCRCEPRHRGNAGFMVAILLSGLKYYHDATGDPRAKEALIRGAHYLLDECYSDEVKGFRYTSCPQTRYRPGATPLMVEGIARAYLWTRDARFRRVLVEALPLAAHGSAYGKGFSMYYRCGPRVLADLAAAGLSLERP